MFHRYYCNHQQQNLGLILSQFFSFFLYLKQLHLLAFENNQLLIFQFFERHDQEEYFINGIENRIEQIIANLLDNSISFSEDNKKILVEIYKGDKDKIILKVIDDGKGFIEIDTKKIFDRFYTNRPDTFGEHSGLGLNIVKNLVDLHSATINASNNITQKGANVEIVFPKV